MSVEKVAVVTGAGSGVGLKTAGLLHRKGFRVVLLDIDGDAALTQATVLDPSGLSVLAARVDICDAGQVRAAIEQVRARWGRVDVLVNNAGMPQANLPFEAVSAQLWSQVLDVNLMGIVHLAQAVVPLMREQGSGRIVNVTSVAGSRARPGMSAYCAAKAAAISLTQTLALELADAGILVNSVAPGSLETPMFRKFLQPDEAWDAAMERYLPNIPLHRLGQPEEIAETVVWVASEAPGFMTGQNIIVDGGRCL
ncbi:3-oxoacyl-ACP reductase [Pseudomonas gingeri NCPPB 3146 = LMG 5327]|uniref:SDR family oxidoreductase n=4 Tax=Pseudomonas gingeri TaxID=117681 RepID=A0A7Y7Y4R4_9PSED|nr:SDR family NAD(P)-dependent oxidoreductase [Pseudomonas gingeri]NWC17852.1 SDR family oxidoreductase [Pseudomonas gingeri]NWE50575.1 SDR family oxidoreductase [Pseudomonas gingeri]NWE73671.1 SDR family oxidoreductase [Pseudomonas gingeri]PNQ94106.1 3-oxoacyl-ACP reductase [Pseudomonas gingeri NCPPB 3146 = LMG 5327]